MNQVKNISLALLTALCFGCGSQPNQVDKLSSMNNKEKEIACKLTSPQLQERRESVLASLKKQIREQQELENGYKFKFETRDSLIDELTSFIKTERACCDFFSFSVLISGDEPYTWLSITGPNGAKDFIRTEMDLVK